MAAFVANTTGLWNNSATWSGAGIPGSGDTGTINNGVTVTIPDGYTAVIGTTGGTTGTTALTTTTTTGKLIIGQGTSGQLRLQGDLQLNGTSSPFAMSAGSSLVFVPASGQRIKVNFNNQNGCVGSITGITQTGRCTVSTDATALSGGGLKGFFTIAASTNEGLINVSFCDFTDIDDGSTIGCIQIFQALSGAQPVLYHDNTFTRCGMITCASGTNTTQNVQFYNNEFISSVGTLAGGVPTTLKVTFGGVTGAGVRQIIDNTLDFGIAATPYSMTIQNNVIQGTVTSSFTTVAPATFDSNILIGTSSANFQVMQVGGTASNNYFMAGFPNNAHFLAPIATAGNYIFTGNIFDGLVATDGQGDCNFNTGAAATNVTITKSIVLPDPAGQDAGVLLTNSATAASGATTTVEHNTIYVNAQMGVSLAETQAGTANMILSLQGNAFWGPSTNIFTGVLLNPGGATNYVTAANCNYNANYNIAAGTSGNGNSITVSSGTPGANNLFGGPSSAPSFIDPYRNLARFPSDYLGLTASKGAWANGTSYVVGDTVTSTVPGYYNGNTVIYRCISNHTSSSSTLFLGQPGVFTLQNLHMSGSPTGGNAVLTFGRLGALGITGNAGNTAWNISAATLQTTVNTKLATVSGHTYTCVTTGGPWPGTDITIEFKDAGVDTNDLFAIYSVTSSALTGGTSPQVLVQGWGQTWEVYGYYVMRKALGARITDASLNLTNASYIQTLCAWVRQGFRPQNQNYGAYYSITQAFPTDTITTDAAGNSMFGTLGAMAYFPNTRFRKQFTKRVGSRGVQ